MIADLRLLIAAQPFQPFMIHTSDGAAAHVPTVDHIAIAPSGFTVVIFHDEGGQNLISPRQIARLSVDATRQNAEAV